ncbi:MAG: peptidase S16 [Salinisphaeraceae bacterium]|nr:peptidase S16 [Salinisphaeraceae bacterium]
MDTVPLFPLSSVLFPGGVMPLRIFEPRYTDMVKLCTREQRGFGICAMEGASEVARHSAPRDVGTLVRIIDFDMLEDGFLGITVQGENRFEVHQRWQADDGLWWGEVTPLDEQGDCEFPDEYDDLKQVLQVVYDRLGEPYASQDRHFDSAAWISARLAELLPFDPATKHALLSEADPVARLAHIQPLVSFDGSGQ